MNDDVGRSHIEGFVFDEPLQAFSHGRQRCDRYTAA